MAHAGISELLRGGEAASRLWIFDKDGTLIDFHAMWSGWAVELAGRLDAAIRQRLEIRDWRPATVDVSNLESPVASLIGRAWNFDPATGYVEPSGHLAIDSMAELRALAIAALRDAGLPLDVATAAVDGVWSAPDPVSLARPLANLPALFGLLRASGALIAVATTDDRAATEATLAALGVAQLVDAMVCGDDGLPLKPEPDMVVTLCSRLAVAPGRAVMVGDTIADVQMGRAAGVGMVVGVLSGAGAAEQLGPYADLLLPSIAAIAG